MIYSLGFNLKVFWTKKTFGTLAFIIGVVFVGIGSYLVIDDIIYKSQAEFTQGKIIRVEENDSGDGKSFYAYIQFENHSGALEERQAKLVSYEWPELIGTEIGVYYTDGVTVKVRTEKYLIRFGLNFLINGIVFCALGIIFIVTHKEKALITYKKL